jgi:hypothetical protein
LLLAGGSKVGVWLSDISGAFDRVRCDRLLCKLRRAGVSENLMAFFKSYFEARIGTVIVESCHSEEFIIADSVFQGTVLGPPCWNIFFSDVWVPVREHNLQEEIYADDLNGFKSYDKSLANDAIVADLSKCADSVHQWGVVNQVKFDPGKEGFRILHRGDPLGDLFKILGVDFDCKLLMKACCMFVYQKCNFKLRCLLRFRKFFADHLTFQLYKSHIMSRVEAVTAAVYHAAPVHLNLFDSLQARLLSHMGLSESTAFLDFNLAPLVVRRDIAMLGVIHKCVLGITHKSLCDLFPLSRIDHAFPASFASTLQTTA